MKTLILTAAIVGLAACSSNNDDKSDDGGGDITMSGYRIELTNLTNNQHLSPPAAILHAGGFRAWEVGQPASEALEELAEGGSTRQLVMLQRGSPNHTANGELLAGASLTFEIGSTDPDVSHLTVATMLVNTNDAFTGLTNVDLSGMQPGDQRVFLTPAYDAGTEFNDELGRHVPGPVAGGEGFNAVRDDVTGVVTHHAGVVGKEDGLTESALSQAERFDNPVLMIRIERL